MVQVFVRGVAPLGSQRGSNITFGRVLRFAGYSFQTRLVAIILMVVLPLNIIIVAAVSNLMNAARDAQRATLLYSARSVAAGVDASLDKHVALAQALLRSVTATTDSRSLQRASKDWFPSLPSVAVRLVNSSELPAQRPDATIHNGSGGSSIHSILTGVQRDASGKAFFVELLVPPQPESSTSQWLAVKINASRFLPLLSRTLQLDDQWIVGIMDGTGHIVARIPNHQSTVGQPASTGWQATAGREGVYEFNSREGDPIVNANAITSFGNWTVGIALKQADLNARAWTAVRGPMLASGLVSVFSLALAWALAQRMSRDVKAAGETVAALLAGQTLPQNSFDIRELGDLHTTVSAAAQERNRIVAELASRHSELLAIYETAQVGLCVLDRDLRFVRINRLLAQINGHPAEAHIGRTVREMVPDLADQVEQIASEIFSTGRGLLNVELSGTTPADREKQRHWLEQWTPIKESDGSVVAINVAVEDITSRKESEAALKRQADRQRYLLEMTYALIGRARDEAEVAQIVFKSIGEALEAECCLNYRVAPDRRTLQLIYQTGFPEAMLPQLARLQLGEAFCGAVAAGNVAIAADREKIRCDPRGAIVAKTGLTAYLCHPLRNPDGDVIGTFSVGTSRRTHFAPEDVDFLQTAANFVSEAWLRLDSERRLADSERLLRQILDGTLAFIGVLDVEGTLREANSPALDAAGLQRSDVVGLKFWDCYWWNHDAVEVERLKEAVKQAGLGNVVRYDAVVRMQGDTLMPIDFMLAPVTDDTGRVVLLVPSGFDISERKNAEEHQHILLRELGHRGKNLIAVVQSLVNRTFVEPRTLPEARSLFLSRLGALANTFSTLTEEGTTTIELRDILENELRAFGGQATLTGPPVSISGKAAQTFSLVVHELATNASKYGALAKDGGHIDVEWIIEGKGPDGLLLFSWRESGGPPPAVRMQQGFGTAIITRIAGATFHCVPKLKLEPTGLYYQFAASLKHFSDEAEPKHFNSTTTV